MGRRVGEHIQAGSGGQVEGGAAVGGLGRSKVQRQQEEDGQSNSVHHLEGEKVEGAVKKELPSWIEEVLLFGFHTTDEHGSPFVAEWAYVGDIIPYFIETLLGTSELDLFVPTTSGANLSKINLPLLISGKSDKFFLCGKTYY